METSWDFVEKYYPNYTSSDEISLADDLSKLTHGEINGDAETMLNEEYGGDINNPKIQADYDRIHVEIYETAIENFIKIESEKLTTK